VNDALTVGFPVDSGARNLHDHERFYAASLRWSARFSQGSVFLDPSSVLLPPHFTTIGIGMAIASDYR
jgi:hypothetical protein